MSLSEVTIPNDWQPRSYQRPLWDYLEGGGKRAVAVWHRRAGKDAACLNWTAVAAHMRVGNYWHMLPEARQGRKVIWDAIDPHTGRRHIDQAFPPEIRANTRNDEMLIRLRCGSTWQVVGSDNYDSLIGSPPVGVVLSEYSVSRPAAWDYLRPILAENGGWALFAYTPRGKNHGAKMYEMAAANPKWFAQLLTVDDTLSIPRSVIDEERASGMPEEMIQQEYYCSFAAGVVGAYYASLIEGATKDGRIRKVPVDPALPVHTVWDLGMDDMTAIWFFQAVHHEIRLVDYCESSGHGLPYYAKVLQDKGYVYGTHLLPHDAKVRELGTEVSRVETLASLGIRATVVEAQSVADGINAVRVMLPRCWFDEQKCQPGIDALSQYRREYDDKRHTYRDTPLHDWTSHASDALRILAMNLHRLDQAKKMEPIKYPNMGIV